uniref:DUF7356 domain-containing protein n=1 Tax=Davidia involucrata TaxID=16924 RepID=A0A5B6ZHV4_DAVIN
MGGNEFLTVIFLLLIASDGSDASLLRNFRKFIAAPKDNSASQISPLPSSDSGGKVSNPGSVDADKSRKEKPKDPQPKVNPKGSNNDNNNTASVSPPTDKLTGKSHEVKEKSDNNSNLQLGTNGSCAGSPKRCRDQKAMVACIHGFKSGSKDLVLVVQIEGDSTLKVNITIPTSVKNGMNEHEILMHQTERINVSLITGQNTKIVLNAGNGDCVLHMGPLVSEGNFFQWLPSYYKPVTPIYGAYFLFLTAVIVGGTWACCKFRKRRRQGGVPYQELEMGLPESASVVNVDTAEGWDQGWDDDWDEDKAVKSPGGRHVGNISANGLTSRTPNRDGWENDWND